MSTAGADSAVNHQVLSHEANDNNGVLSKTINKSKIYPLEGSAHSDIRNDYDNEKVSPVEMEESRKDPTIPKKQKSLWKRNLIQAIILLFAIIIIALAFIAVIKYYILDRSRPELIYINMIWRHGDRAPTHDFLNFTEKYMIAFPEGIGNLTKIGMEQAEQLGLLLRRRYIYPENITSKQIYIRSTSFNRTIKTAEYVLTGMSFSDVKINAEIATDVDTTGNPFFECDAANQFVRDQNEKYFLRENFSEIYELMKRELNYSGNAYNLFDTLVCLKKHDLLLPDWLRDEKLYEKLKFLSWHGVEAMFGLGPYNNELQRKIRGGSSLRGVVSRIACKVNYSDWKAVDSCDERFYGLSAHDMTLVSILSTFSDIHSILGKTPLVNYGANIAFEIWRIDDSYKMKVLYANQWDEEPQDITKFAPGCDDLSKFCNVTKFIEQSRLLFFDDVQKECSKGAENLTSHIVKRSIGPENMDDAIDLIELY
ncbi:Histidine phosphatase (branch 2) family protein [Acanthocheilonema viteae]